ncbi:MAG TPA: hypothetical protein VM490_18840 [Armatimonadaceae bacterium]|nr:hypothetical protein [Armatimonadaceae bacterium]
MTPAAPVAARLTPLRVREAAAFRMPVRTRMPFRYGIATVTDLPHLFVRVRLALGDGTEAVGMSADHLAPKWFTKDPATAFEDDAAEMLRVISRAMETAADLGECGSVFDLWSRLYAAQARWARAHAVAPLLAHFGTSLVERAVIDAVCRAAGRPFADLLRENDFGIRLGDVHPELGDAHPADLLPALGTPLPRILARHTVGLSDPLVEADRTEEHQVSDGLPVTLEECVRVYGLRHFKLKVGADAARYVPRLERTIAVIRQNRPHGDDFAFSLDGNEAFTTVADFRAFWDAFTASPALRRDALPRLLFVEQPLHRSVALSPETGAAFADWPERPPIIIDESDAETTSLPTALSLGYAGTSHKNCKGVIKGIANACLIAHCRRCADPATPLILSGEDLTNIGPVAQMQDLAVQAALGIESVERNGHHYFSGLSMFPQAVQDATLRAHPDLYHSGLAGFATLTVADGALDLGTVNAAPGLGVGFLPDVEAFAERV